MPVDPSRNTGRHATDSKVFPLLALRLLHRLANSDLVATAGKPQRLSALLTTSISALALKVAPFTL
jgi:hypothetical protein